MNKKGLYLVILSALISFMGESAVSGEDSPGARSPLITNTISIDRNGTGRLFNGVGAISAGGSSRLLYDYPEPERSQILDYLFTPNYGASLHILKVEIGGDIDATSGSEPSHMRTPVDRNCNRGYEWWLMKEAQSRNPEIQFYALEWGAPGWFEGGYWSDDNIKYILKWLDCAKGHGFTIDYLGGGNEMGYDMGFYVKLKKALLENGYEHIKVVASDNHHPPVYWGVATDMKKNPEFNNAIDIIGEHDVCRWRTPYYHCDITEDALSIGKPLWNSEQSTEDYADWAPGLARAMNRNYIDGKVTGNLNWAIVSAIYGTFRCAGTGLILADKPWSGYYDLGKGIWVDAHTTQFVEPGWRYLDNAYGYTNGGASFVTLVSPDNADYSIVIETMDIKSPEKIEIEPGDGFSGKKVSLWKTNIFSNNTKEHFVFVKSMKSDGDMVELEVEPGFVYTLSTTTGQGKGAAKPAESRDALLPLPHVENFEQASEIGLAKYFADIHGAFEVAPCTGGREGNCYRQVIGLQPVVWHNANMDPTTIMGDPDWWGDYKVCADVFLEGSGFVELIGRVESQMRCVSGYHLRISDKGGWTLYTEDVAGKCTTLASGDFSIELERWYTLQLEFIGNRIVASVDGVVLGEVRDDSHTTGQVGLRVGRWQQAQFDNVEIVPTAGWPEFVPLDRASVTATSTHEKPYIGYMLTPDKIIDKRIESLWRSEWEPTASLPQSVTIDLGKNYLVKGLVYYPPLAMGTDGMINRYHIYLSKDGKTFDKVASGEWLSTTATKTAIWGSKRKARYIKLEAIEAEKNFASIGEIKIMK